MHPKSVMDMQKNAGKAADFLSGLSSPHRLQILCLLAEGEKSVTELVEGTGLLQTSMSQHLKKLKETKIVDFRREHRVLYYSIVHPMALEIMGVMHKYYCAGKGKKHATK